MLKTYNYVVTLWCVFQVDLCRKISLCFLCGSILSLSTVANEKRFTVSTGHDFVRSLAAAFHAQFDRAKP